MHSDRRDKAAFTQLAIMQPTECRKRKYGAEQRPAHVRLRVLGVTLGTEKRFRAFSGKLSYPPLDELIQRTECQTE